MDTLTAWLVAAALGGSAAAWGCDRRVRQARASVRRLYETTALPDEEPARGKAVMEMLDEGARRYEAAHFFFTGRIVGWLAAAVGTAGLTARAAAALLQ